MHIWIMQSEDCLHCTTMFLDYIGIENDPAQHNTHGKEHTKTCWSPLEKWLPEYQTVWPVSVLQKNLGESILPRVGSSWRLVQQRYHPRRSERMWWKLQTSSITRGELGKHRWGGPWRHPEIIGVWRALVKVGLKERPCSGTGEKAREN